MSYQLLKNASIYTADDQIGLIKNGTVVIQGEKIVWVGDSNHLPEAFLSDGNITIDCKGKLLTPGLIDCHTHLVYAGDRADEWAMRHQGASYEEIAKAGGGILSTVQATRKASFDDLYKSTKKRVDRAIRNGVTTLEIKSGYGLDLETERKQLQVARQIEADLPITIKTTFLAAHALAPEFDSHDAYIEHICDEMLPTLAGETFCDKPLIDAVDIYCEHLAFTTKHAERLFQNALKLDLPVKMHAEQFSDIGGSELAAKHGALSVDHLEYLSDESINAIRKSGHKPVAVLLPFAFYCLGETKCPPTDALKSAGMNIAIATDHNPGSAPAEGLTIAMHLAARIFGLQPSDVLDGVTSHAAKAVNIDDERGKIAKGFYADIALWDFSQPHYFCYALGAHEPIMHWQNGVEQSKK